jgi:hypothetical protein
MSSIDWSDPYEMVGLLIEYVADERNASHGDAERAAFLRALEIDLENLALRDYDTVDEIAGAILEARDSQPSEFLDDDVMTHVDACIEELHRISRGSRKAGR